MRRVVCARPKRGRGGKGGSPFRAVADERVLVIGIKAWQGLIVLEVDSVILLSDGIDRPATLQAGDDDFLWTRRPDRLIALDERGPLDPLVHVRPPDFQSSGIDGKNLLSPELGGVSGFPIVDVPIVA